MSDHRRERDAGAEPRFAVSVSRLPQDGTPVRLEAGPDERLAIARRLGLLDVGRLEADLTLRPGPGEGVAVDGELRADVVQEDVVTLDPLPRAVHEPVRLLFVPEGSPLVALPEEPDAEIEVSMADDPPETFRGDRVELGEPLIQLLGVALDPYPRATGVAFEPPTAEEGEPSPFAVLARLKREAE